MIHEFYAKKKQRILVLLISLRSCHFDCTNLYEIGDATTGVADFQSFMFMTDFSDQDWTLFSQFWKCSYSIIFFLLVESLRMLP